MSIVPEIILIYIYIHIYMCVCVSIYVFFIEMLIMKKFVLKKIFILQSKEEIRIFLI